MPGYILKSYCRAYENPACPDSLNGLVTTMVLVSSLQKLNLATKHFVASIQEHRGENILAHREEVLLLARSVCWQSMRDLKDRVCCGSLVVYPYSSLKVTKSHEEFLDKFSFIYSELILWAIKRELRES